MKTSTKTIILLIVFCCTFQIIHAQKWRSMNTLDGSFNDVCAVSNDSVFIVGENGLIARSINRGEKWNKQNISGNPSIIKVKFNSSQLGLALSTNGGIYRTQDGGDNWVSVSPTKVFKLKTFAFASAQNIWAVGDSGLILHSSDAGTSWLKIDTLTHKLNMNDVKFKNDFGYIVGDSGFILKTINGGQSWEKESFPSKNILFSLNIAENRSFLLSSGTSKYGEKYGLQFTTQGNTKWEQVESNFHTLRGGFQGLIEQYFLNDTIGYAISGAYPTCGCGPMIEIAKSIDGGKTWKETEIQPASSGGDLSRITMSFANDTTGYIVSKTLLLKAVPLNYNYSEIKNNELSNRVKFIVGANDELMLRSENSAIENVQVMGISGNTFFTKTFNGYLQEIRLPTNSLVKGIYIIKIALSNQQIFVGKWIKK